MSYFRVNLILLVRSGFMSFRSNIDDSTRVIIFGLSMLLSKAGNIDEHEINLWTSGSFALACAQNTNKAIRTRKVGCQK